MCAAARLCADQLGFEPVELRLGDHAARQKVMQALQLVRGGGAGRIDDLHFLRVVDKDVEAGFASVAGRPWPVDGAQSPDQGDTPADDSAAEGHVDDQNEPAVRVVTPERDDGGDRVDDGEHKEED